MPRIFQEPAKVAVAFSGLSRLTLAAALVSMVLLLAGAIQWTLADHGGRSLTSSAAWRQSAFPWLMFGFASLFGLVVLAAALARRAHLEDMAQRRMLKATEALEIMLEEKEALLAEVHHRVKNNMQVVVSLLQMEADRLPDAGTRKRMDAVGQRIALIGRIHERVYASESFARMDFAAHLAEHCSELAKSDEGRLALQLESLYCGLDTAQPLGLIAHELVSNALNHGPSGQTPIEVKLVRAGNMVELSVTDAGPGPAEGSAPGMGGILVQLLAEQLEAGVLARHTAHGYCVRVTVPGSLFR